MADVPPYDFDALLNNRGLLLTTPHTGLVASGAASPATLNVPNKQIQFRSAHVAMDDITSLQVVYPNWYVSGGEKGTGVTATISVGLEYPAGVFGKQLLFSGNASGSIPNLSEATSDALPVRIPKGAVFWLNGIWQSTAGVIYGGNANILFGEKTVIAASGLSDPSQTGLPGIAYTVGAITLRPVAIIAQTRVGSLSYFGDSRVFGQGDTPSGEQLEVGISRVLGRQIAVLNAGRGGETASSSAPAFTRRAAIAAYTNGSILQFGINDLNGGSTPNIIQGNLATMKALLPAGKPVLLSTYEPVTTSTDNWATTANQTIGNTTTQGGGTAAAVEANRKAMITWVKTIPTGYAGYLDTAAAVESGGSGASGLWIGATPPLTVDGTHETRDGYVKVRDSAPASTAFFQ